MNLDSVTHDKYFSDQYVLGAVFAQEKASDNNKTSVKIFSLSHSSMQHLMSNNVLYSCKQSHGEKFKEVLFSSGNSFFEHQQCFEVLPASELQLYLTSAVVISQEISLY